MSTASPDVLKDLAPTGTLRASINLGNIVLAQGTPDNPTGVKGEPSPLFFVLDFK